jgi:hypothetical protein
MMMISLIVVKMLRIGSIIVVGAISGDIVQTKGNGVLTKC